MATRLVLLAVLAAALAGRATAACPAPRRAVPRPAALGSVFPTPRTYVYTSGKRRTDGAGVVTGYLKESMNQAYADWWSTIAGSGRYHGFPQEGRTHTVIAFKAWSGTEHGRVDIYVACKNRMTAVITYFAK